MEHYFHVENQNFFVKNFTRSIISWRDRLKKNVYVDNLCHLCSKLNKTAEHVLLSVHLCVPFGMDLLYPL